MKQQYKNVKISEEQHKQLKEYCDRNGLKIYKLIEKWIKETCVIQKNTKKDIYGD
jgi:t-SNARE complex subunit (syntaxin)